MSAPSKAFAPTRLQNVYLVAEQPAALHAFYSEALGLSLKFADGERWYQYGVGGGNVSLACREEAAPATSGAVMVFEVADFDGAAERIAAAGGEVLGLRDMGAHGSVLSLRDPEGHVVQLFRRSPPANAAPMATEASSIHPELSSVRPEPSSVRPEPVEGQGGAQADDATRLRQAQPERSKTE
ncbi:MAG: VOC family protein [Pseudacidovorax sp.]|nr:VOC family protein [Pseudacidovorax sp.]